VDDLRDGDLVRHTTTGELAEVESDPFDLGGERIIKVLYIGDSTNGGLPHYRVGQPVKDFTLVRRKRPTCDDVADADGE
jgi:hypothetical protein